MHAGRGVAAQQTQPLAFDHAKHQRLFPTCTACHAQPATGEGSLYPDPATCATCHDGTVKARITWRAPVGPRRTNLRFEHGLVPIMIRADQPEPPRCTVCHGADDGRWMAVQRVNFGRCLSCHGVRTAHLAAPDTMCTVCHVPLAEAETLTREDIAAFPTPPSHMEAGWVGGGGHGKAAQSGAQRGGGHAPVAASCATCHAREFCLTCHVDAPERPTIQALPSDPRSTAIVVRLRPPPSHAEPAFLNRHGATARSAPVKCSSCHARESCVTCHVGTPQVAAALPTHGAGRGIGAIVERHRPVFHGPDFARGHGAMAARTPATCAGCHVQSDCLECHRLDAGTGPGYHPSAFLARHPAAAYARETSCSDCHNPAGFCTTCHAAAGLVSSGTLQGGFHDANSNFIGGHGQAARQSLETCVSCHVERDCLPCHSANGGRRFNPHGPGFDADRLRRKNPQMCTVCHGTAIPGQ